MFYSGTLGVIGCKVWQWIDNDLATQCLYQTIAVPVNHEPEMCLNTPTMAGLAISTKLWELGAQIKANDMEIVYVGEDGIKSGYIFVSIIV